MMLVWLMMTRCGPAGSGPTRLGITACAAAALLCGAGWWLPHRLRPMVGPVDPQASLEALARRLEDAHRADPGNALLARELRMTLGKLAGGDGADDGLAEFLTRLSG
jgi:hypothetical protein